MTSRSLALPSLCLLALLSFSHAVPAQTSDPWPRTADCSKLPSHAQEENCAHALAETKIVYLTNATSQVESNDILIAVRNMFDPSLKVFLLTSQNAVVLSSYPVELARVEAFMHSLDVAHKLYRLTYTIATTEGGKTIGTQHYSLLAADGQRTTLKEGDKVPVATGSYATENATSQTQFTYLDVGMSFDATVNSVAGGVSLKSKVEQSSIGQTSTIAGVTEPIVRQSVVDGYSIAQLGKPLMLGSIDIPNTTRRLDIDVMIEPVK